jgi:type II secretion system protein H
MRSGPSNRSGFTLIELMIVLVLIGIFSGLMLAEMRGTYEDALLRSSARKIISAVNLAASKAVTVNRNHAVWLNPAENRLKIQLENQSEPIEEMSLDSRITVIPREPSQPLEEDETPEDAVPPKGDLQKITFHPDGTADSREIVLRDRMGIELVLRINPVTGRIRALESEAPK